jgi:hypothetical protein
MMEEIVNQLISCSTATALWSSIHAMFSAQKRAGVRHIQRQIQAMKKGDMTASEYMGKVKALADAMTAAGPPLRDDEVTDYMPTGLGRSYNPTAASLNVTPTAVYLSAFYSMVLNCEVLQLSQQADDEDLSSSANSAMRSGQTSRPRAPGSLIRQPSLWRLFSAGARRLGPPKEQWRWWRQQQQQLRPQQRQQLMVGITAAVNAPVASFAGIGVMKLQIVTTALIMTTTLSTLAPPMRP